MAKITNMIANDTQDGAASRATRSATAPSACVRRCGNDGTRVYARGLCAALALAALAPAVARSVPIRSVEALTLQAGRLTTGRRSAPVPQLTCRGSNCRHSPSAVRCTNAGFDGTDAQWDCKAEMDPSVRFGDLNVQCEGYDYANDPNILIGSCGLEYTLAATGAPSAASGGGGGGGYHSGARSTADGDGLLGGLVMLGLVFVAFSACASGGGGGGGGRCYDSGYGGGYGGYRRDSSGPGFWSGAAAGAMGASALNSRSYGGGGWSRGGGGGGGSWGGGGGSTHSSTGFASTSRR